MHYLKRQRYFLFIILFFSARGVFAASLYMQHNLGADMGRGQEFSVDLVLNTDGAVINALEGSFHIDSAFSLKEIKRGNSLISLWTEAPHLEDQDIVFSGIVPGGYRGSQGYLFTLVLAATKIDDHAILEAQDFSVFLHDGEGSAVPVDTQTLTFNIASDIPLVSEEQLYDTRSPEPFIPIVSQETSLFDGKAVVIFAAQDKESGIAQYEVRERKIRAWSSRGTWDLATSPYLLRDQSLKSFIYVRATDQQGNQRIVVIPPERFSPLRHLPALILILLLLFFWRVKKYAFSSSI